MLPTMHWLHLLPIISAAAAILLPAPNGRFPVSASVHSLTDESRMDPYAPANKRHKRKVLTSLYLPIQGKNTKISKRKLPYMTPAVAEDYGLFAEGMGLPNTTFASFEIETSSLIDRSPPCSGRHSSTKGSHKVPLVLFSPGSGQSRLLYTTMAMSLASEGYAVLTIDHPYDAPVVEFPDGTIIRAVEISDEDTKALEELVQVHAADVSFVVDQVKTSKTFSRVLQDGNLSINPSQTVMYGHSLGGATAAAVMLKDRRIKGGVNLDGRFFEPVISKGLDRPFALLGRPDHAAEDKTWPTTFKKLRGPRFEMEVANSTHGSFTDFPVLIDSLNLPKSAKDMIEQSLGSIPGERMDLVVKSVMVAFADLVFGNTRSPALLRKGQSGTKELKVLQSSLRE